MANTVEQHFDGRSPRVRDIYDTIVVVSRVHEIKLGDPGEIDPQILGWLRESYELSV